MNITPKTDPVNVIASDQPTTCGKDGTRTVWHGQGKDIDGEAYQTEVCPHCKTIYHVYDPDAETLAADEAEAEAE